MENLQILFNDKEIHCNGFVITNTTRSDLDLISQWPKFENRTDSWANFPAGTSELRDKWFDANNRPFLVWFSVRNKELGNNEILARASLTAPGKGNELLYGLVVRPDFKNKGLGTGITKIIIKAAFQLTDVTSIWLESERDNLGAHRVWEKIGFQRLNEHYRRDSFGRYFPFIGYRFPKSQSINLCEVRILNHYKEL